MAPERLNIVDFSLGVLNTAEEIETGLALNCRDRNVDRAFEHASRQLNDLIDSGEEPSVELGFRIVTDAFGSDSVQGTMINLAGWGYLRQLGDSFFYGFDRNGHETAEAFHEAKRIPGNINTYRRLAPGFIQMLRWGEIVPVIERQVS